MRIALRILGISILCVQVAFATAWAQEREPAGIFPTVARRDIKPIQLSYEATNEARNLLFDNMQMKMKLAKNLIGFRALFLSHLSKQDQYAFTILAAKTDRLPTFRRVDNRLVATLGSEKVVVQWPDPLRSELIINGMKVVLKVDRPLLEQTVVLSERLRHRKTAGLLNLVLPDAHATLSYGTYKITYGVAETVAEAAVRTGLFKRLWAATKNAKQAVLIGGVLAALQSEVIQTMAKSTSAGFTNLFCLVNEQVNHLSWLTLCSDWEKERSEKIWKDIRLDSLITIEAASKNGKTLDSEELACPTKNDKKDRVLLTKIRPVEWKDGVKVPLRDEYSMLRAVFNHEGHPKSLMVGPLGLDMEKALETEDGRNQIWLQVSFEKEGGKGQVTGIEISNPAYKKSSEQRKEQVSSDKGILSEATQKVVFEAEPATLEIDPSMRLTPPQNERLNTALRIVDWAKGKTFECVVSRAIDQIKEGIDPKAAAETEPAKVQPAKTSK